MKWCITFLWLLCLPAFSQAAAWSRLDSLNNAGIKSKIQTEIGRIQLTYDSVSTTVIHRTNLLSAFIDSNYKTPLVNSAYQQRLLSFLQTIDKPYGAEYFYSGRYEKNINFYAAYLMAKRQGLQKEFLYKEPEQSLRAFYFLDRDSVTDQFLMYCSKEYPDEVFRNYENYMHNPLRTKAITQAAEQAPESARRYFGSINRVKSVLFSINDSEVNILKEIYNQFGVSNSLFLFLDGYVNGYLTYSQAAEILQSDEKTFRTLMEIMKKEGSLGQYSISRELIYRSADIIRKVNAQSSNEAKAILLNKYSAQEFMALAVFGVNEMNRPTLEFMVNELGRRYPMGISAIDFKHYKYTYEKNFLISLRDFNVLENFVAFCHPSYKKMIPAMVNGQDDPFPFDADMFFVKWEKQMKTLQPINISSSTLSLDPVGFNPDQLSGPQWMVEPHKNLSPVEAQDASFDRVQISDDKESALFPEDMVSIGNRNSSNLAISDQIESIIEVDPLPPPEPPLPPLRLNLSPEEKEKFKLFFNVENSLKDISSFIEKPYAAEFLKYAAEQRPDDVFRFARQYQSKNFAQNVLETTARLSPTSFQRYVAVTDHPAHVFLKNSNDPVVKKLYEINDSLGTFTRAYLLADDIYKNRSDIRQTDKRAGDSRELFTRLINITNDSDAIGQVSVQKEIQGECLQFIRKINDLEGQGSSVQFASLRNLSATEIYTIMVNGEQEIFNTTFAGCYNQLKLKLAGQDHYHFLENIKFYRFRSFIEMASRFGKLNDFFAGMSSSNQKLLIERFVCGLNKHIYDPSEAIYVADAIGSMKDEYSIQLCAEAIKSCYLDAESNKDNAALAIYALLLKKINGKVSSDTKWFNKQANRIQVEETEEMDFRSLQNANGEIIIVSFFYNDDDGAASYRNFLTYYKAPDWTIEDYNTYIVIKSNIGNKIIMYANKPEFESNGQKEMSKYLDENGISPSIYIHRGHSFYTEKSIAQMENSARFVFLGSCGGYYNLPSTYLKCPGAQCIATRQIGTKSVNDPMIKEICEDLRHGKNIDWPNFYSEMQQRCSGNKMFNDYVLPHQNTSTSFINAYCKLLGIE